jgi:hypothetical protein
MRHRAQTAQTHQDERTTSPVVSIGRRNTADSAIW